MIPQLMKIVFQKVNDNVGNSEIGNENFKAVEFLSQKYNSD